MNYNKKHVGVVAWNEISFPEKSNDSTMKCANMNQQAKLFKKYMQNKI